MKRYVSVAEHVRRKYTDATRVFRDLIINQRILEIAAKKNQKCIIMRDELD